MTCQVQFLRWQQANGFLETAMKATAAFTYIEAEKEKISAESLRNKLKLKSFEAQSAFSKKHSHAAKYFKFKGLSLGKIREHSARLLSSSALAGALLLTPPSLDIQSLPSPHEILEKLRINDNELNAIEKVERRQQLEELLEKNLPDKPRPLSRDEEKVLEPIFKELYNIPAKANLEGEHLNTTHGYIGIEQHLRRFPGDNLSFHGSKEDQKEGMAPGLGAWGYFANSKAEFTKDLEEKEKWYSVVQTLYLHDWNRRQPHLKEWYKFRKVLIVNTANGNAVVSAVADSGPAAFTGKQFGGSPEVMEALGGSRYTKGAVVIFFVDDPDNKVPLGPVSIQ